MSVDTILEFQLVLSSGVVQTVTAASDPDLFWALKVYDSPFITLTASNACFQPLGRWKQPWYRHKCHLQSTSIPWRVGRRSQL